MNNYITFFMKTGPNKLNEMFEKVLFLFIYVFQPDGAKNSRPILFRIQVCVALLLVY